jgi:hypothetical protein
MFADDLSLAYDDDALGLHSHADWTIGEGGRHAVAIAVQDGPGTSAARAWRIRRSRRTGAKAASDAGPLRPRRRQSRQDARRAASEPTVPGSACPASRSQRRQRGEARRGLPEPMASMPRTFFLICPFSQPDAGLQNSGSNGKWLTMAANRALTWRFFPRPDLVDPGAHIVVNA